MEMTSSEQLITILLLILVDKKPNTGHEIENVKAIAANPRPVSLAFMPSASKLIARVGSK